MKTKTPPVIQCDQKGRVINYVEIARWAFQNDPVFRATQQCAEEVGESYIATLERHTAVQVLTRQQMIEDHCATAAMERHVIVHAPAHNDDSPFTDPQLFVSSPSDAPHYADPDEGIGAAMGILLMLLVNVSLIGIAIWAGLNGKHGAAVTFLVIGIVGITAQMRGGAQ